MRKAVEMAPENAAPDAGEYRIGRDATIRFTHDAQGNVTKYSLDFRGERPNAYDALQSDWMEKAHAARGGDIPALRAEVMAKVEQLLINQQALDALWENGQGTAEEAEYLERAIQKAAAAMERQYGDILKNEE
jgi:hypothetical protein